MGKSKSILIPRELVEYLEELAACAEMDSYGAEMKLINPKLRDFASEVYKITHWYTAPDCRPNHRSWEPKSTEKTK